jgi:hypothetical protein
MHRETRDRDFGSPVIKSSDSHDDKPDEWTRFFQRILESVTTIRCEEEIDVLGDGR